MQRQDLNEHPGGSNELPGVDPRPLRELTSREATNIIGALIGGLLTVCTKDNLEMALLWWVGNLDQLPVTIPSNVTRLDALKEHQLEQEREAALKKHQLEQTARELALAPDHAGVCWVEGNAPPELDQPYARTASCDIMLVIVGRDWRPA